MEPRISYRHFENLYHILRKRFAFVRESVSMLALALGSTSKSASRTYVQSLLYRLYDSLTMTRKRLYREAMDAALVVRVPRDLLRRARRAKVNLSDISRRAIEKTVMNGEIRDRQLRARREKDPHP